MENPLRCMKGTSVRDSITTWGFSPKISTHGCELQRIRTLFNKIDCLRSTKPLTCVKYNAMYDPEAWYINPSPEKYKPVWNIPSKRPLITFSSTAHIFKTSNMNLTGQDYQYPVPGRSCILQGTDKWYLRGKECCPRSCLTSCPATLTCS